MSTESFDEASGLAFCRHLSSAAVAGAPATYVVLAHGLGCSKKWFSVRSQLSAAELAALPESALGSDVSWIVPDLLGFGSSRKAATRDELDMTAQGRRLFDLVARLVKPHDSVVCVGHSMGGPVAVAFAEAHLQAPARRFQLRALLIAEGNIDEGDCFGSGKIAAQSFDAYAATFTAKLANDLAAFEAAQHDAAALFKLARGEPANDPKQVEANGAATMHGSSAALVAVSKHATMIPRLLALCSASVPLVFIIGEKNRGVYTSERAIRDAGMAQREVSPSSPAQPGDIAFVPNCGHGMHYDAPTEFWRTIAEILTRC
jgi:pimeloyl-ACP methyl ester carboxylesterase